MGNRIYESELCCPETDSNFLIKDLLKPLTLSIIIPAFNESTIILENVDEVAQWIMKKYPTSAFEIIIIDDGSTDGMSDLIINAQSERPWLMMGRHPYNMGRGRGIRTGFSLAKGDFIICLDADLSYGPEHIETLLIPLIENTADITLASPYHKDGKVKNVPHQRAFLSRIGNKILGLGFNKEFSTVTCVVRGFKKEVIQALELVNNGKELHLEILQKAKLLGFRIQEIPSKLIWRDKKRHTRPRKLLPEIAIFKMRKTVLSHLAFNYVSNPGILLFIPILFLSAIILSGSVMLLSGLLLNITPEQTLFHALRQTLIDGQLSLTIVLFSFTALMIFVVFYFLSLQNKRHFEDIYILIARMHNHIKQQQEEKK